LFDRGDLLLEQLQPLQVTQQLGPSVGRIVSPKRPPALTDDAVAPAAAKFTASRRASSLGEQLGGRLLCKMSVTLSENTKAIGPNNGNAATVTPQATV